MIRQALATSLFVVSLAIAQPVLADVVGTGGGTICGQNNGLVVGTSGPVVGAFTFDPGSRLVFGSSIDLASSVGGMTLATTATLTAVDFGASTAETTWFGSFGSSPLGSLSFSVPPGAGFTSGSLVVQSFIGEIDTLVQSIGLPPGLTYSVDGLLGFTGPCDFSGPGAGDGNSFLLEVALNAFDPQPTPAGPNVTVSGETTFFSPVDGSEVSATIDVTFGSVDGAGETTVTAASDTLVTVPSNFAVAIGDAPVLYLDITTTADVSGPITVCGPYADVAPDDGIVDGTEAAPVPETSLRVLHEEPGAFGPEFVDRTDFVATDYTLNRLCGTVSSLSQFVIAQDLDAPADSDGDGVPDDLDVCEGGDDNVDTDADGVADFCDLCPFDVSNDSDNDLVCDSDDQCLGDDASGDDDVDGLCNDSDPCVGMSNSDADGDGICDEGDQCLGDDATGNTDGDGVCDDLDECDGDDATGDTDGDLVCDDMDICPLDADNDADGDGLCESDDNCPDAANSDQNDLDGDGVGDACDPDADGDGVENGSDNCEFDSNPDQNDADGDGAGDACDADDDGDGVLDADDACMPTPLGEVVDATGCSVGQFCPCEHPTAGARWKNHGAYVSCVAHASEDFLAAGLISEAEKDAIVSMAGASECGQKNK